MTGTLPLPTPGPRILIAGVGNLLRGDDMFGIEVARRLQELRLPPSVHIVETGIAGISLVHELLAGYDALLVVDAVARKSAPGKLVVLEPRLPGPTEITEWESLAFVADLHQSDPSRVLMLSRALGCLPRQVRILGCEVGDCDELLAEPTTAVAEAIPRAVAMALDMIHSWLGHAAVETQA